MMTCLTSNVWEVASVTYAFRGRRLRFPEGIAMSGSVRRRWMRSAGRALIIAPPSFRHASSWGRWPSTQERNSTTVDSQGVCQLQFEA